MDLCTDYARQNHTTMYGTDKHTPTLFASVLYVCMVLYKSLQKGSQIFGLRGNFGVVGWGVQIIYDRSFTIYNS